MTTFKCRACGGHWSEGPTRDHREDQACRYCMEDLLVSARAIAERRGYATNWDAFDQRLASLGVGTITPRTFRIVASATAIPCNHAIGYWTGVYEACLVDDDTAHMKDSLARGEGEAFKFCPRCGSALPALEPTADCLPDSE